jgi:hypothetical protein
MIAAAIVGLATLAGTPAQAQTHDAATLEALLPTAPSQWSAADGDTVEGQGAGIEVAQVSRTYTHAAATTVGLTIISSSTMVMAAKGLAVMFANPAMLNQMNARSPDTQYTAISQGGWTGWTVVNGEDGESEATGFTDNLLVKIELNRADAETLSMFVGLVPWNRLAALHR